MTSLQQLPSPILLIGAAQAGKSNLASEFLSPDQGADIIGSCDPQDPMFSTRVAELKSFRPSLWKSHDACADVLHILGQTQGSQIIIDSASQWLGQIAMTSSLKSYDAIDQQIKDSCQQFAVALRAVKDRRVVITTAEAGYDFAPQDPIRRILRNRTCEFNRELGRIARSVILVTAGIPHVIKGE